MPNSAPRLPGRMTFAVPGFACAIPRRAASLAAIACHKSGCACLDQTCPSLPLSASVLQRERGACTQPAPSAPRSRSNSPETHRNTESAKSKRNDRESLQKHTHTEVFDDGYRQASHTGSAGAGQLGVCLLSPKPCPAARGPPAAAARPRRARPCSPCSRRCRPPRRRPRPPQARADGRGPRR